MDPFRMSRTKLNFNKKDTQERFEEKSTSSFFRRIFCLSPKISSPQNIRSAFKSCNENAEAYNE